MNDHRDTETIVFMECQDCGYDNHEIAFNYCEGDVYCPECGSYDVIDITTWYVLEN